MAGGCGRIATTSPSAPHVSPAVVAVGKRCRSFGPTSRAALVGQRPSPVGSGPCPPADLRQIVGLVDRLRAAVRGNGTVCSLLTPNYRSNAQRWQGEPPGYPSCDVAVLKVGGTVNPKLQFAQPVGRILLFEETEEQAQSSPFPKRRPQACQPIHAPSQSMSASRGPAAALGRLSKLATSSETVASGLDPAVRIAIHHRTSRGFSSQGRTPERTPSHLRCAMSFAMSPAIRNTTLSRRRARSWGQRRRVSR